MNNDLLKVYQQLVLEKRYTGVSTIIESQESLPQQDEHNLVKQIVREIENRIIIIEQVSPHFAHFLRTLKIVVTPAVSTAAVDPLGNLYFNPHFWRQLPIEEATFVLLHEALHIIRKDTLRAETQHPTRGCWTRLLLNIASDYKINYALVKDFKDAKYTTGGYTKGSHTLSRQFSSGLFPDSDGVLRSVVIPVSQEPFKFTLKHAFHVEELSTEEMMNAIQRELLAVDHGMDLYAALHKLQCGTYPEGYTPPPENDKPEPQDSELSVGDRVTHNKTGRTGTVTDINKRTKRVTVDWDETVEESCNTVKTFKDFYILSEDVVSADELTKISPQSGKASSNQQGEPQQGDSSDSSSGSGETPANQPGKAALDRIKENEKRQKQTEKQIRDMIRRYSEEIKPGEAENFDKHIYDRKASPAANPSSQPSASTGHGVSPSELPSQEELEQSIDEHIKAAKNAGGAGEVMGSFGDLEPDDSIDWKELLEDVVGSLVSDVEETYTARHVYFPRGELPGERRTSANKKIVIVAVDTSGSVHEYRKQFLEASADIFNQVSDKIDFGLMLWDGKVFPKESWLGAYSEPPNSVFADSDYVVGFDEDSIDSIRDAQTDTGGGGTNMFVVAEALNNEHDIYTPDAVVWLTDGIYPYDNPVTLDSSARKIAIITKPGGDVKSAEQSKYFDDIATISV